MDPISKLHASQLPFCNGSFAYYCYFIMTVELTMDRAVTHYNMP